MSGQSGVARIGALFDRLRQRRRAGLGTYVVAGDPNLAMSGRVLRSLPKHGADLIELGFPFSDPVAEGKDNQAGHARALASGTRVSDVFDLVSAFRREDDTTPLLLMGYFNPVLRLGTSAFARAAAAAGADGLIIVDQPLEEATELAEACARYRLAHVLLVAPTTSGDRMAAIGRLSTGFLYCAGAAGATGTQPIDLEQTAFRVRAVRNVTELPVAVGFGIRTAADVAEVGHFADLAIVGSALVRAMGSVPASGAAAAVTELTASFARALQRGHRPRRSGTSEQKR
jgi:tryptophan synthase alpha chain